MEFGVDNEVLRSFQQEVRNYLPVIQEGVRDGANGAAGEAREIARTIASAASMLGLSDLKDAAGELERGLDGEDRSGDDAFLAALACLEQFSLEEIEATEEQLDFSAEEMELWPDDDEEPPPPARVETADEIVSDELLEIYQAESEEHLGFVAQHLQELEQDLSRRDLVQEVRRSIHTLKGAAAMVGLRTAGNLAKRAQDFLDSVCEGAIELTPEVLELVASVSMSLDELARAGVPGEDLKNRAGELRDEMGRLLESGAEDLSRLAEAVAPPAAAEQPQRGEASDQIASQELLEIYQSEAEEQLEIAARCVRALEQDPADRDAIQDLRRAVHTLKGAAGMVGLSTAGALAHRAEDLLDQLYEGAAHATPEAVQLLFATTDLLQDLSRAGLPGEDLVAKARELQEAFGQLSAQEPAAAPEEPPAEAEAAPSEPAEVVPDTEQTAPEPLESVFEPEAAVPDAAEPVADAEEPAAPAADADAGAAEAPFQPVADAPVDAPVPPELAAEEDATEPEPLPQPIFEAAREPAAQPQPEVRPETEEKDEIVSEEMLEVFREEAEEQLRLVSKNLRGLEAKPADRDLIQEVRRSVHTLKGAAGMVGLRSAQNLSHRAEDYLDELFEGQRTLTPQALRLLFETADVLDDLARAGLPGEALRERAHALRGRFGDLLATPRVAPSAPEPEAPETPEAALETPSPLPEPEPTEQAAAQPETTQHEPESADAPEPAAVEEPPAEVAPAPKPEPIEAPAPPPEPRPEPVATPAKLKPAPRVPQRKPRLQPAAQSAPAASGQYVRVPIERVDELVRMVSELVVHRSTLEQQVARYSRELGEHDLTTGRLRRLAVRLEDDFAAKALLAVQSTAHTSAGRGATPDPVQGVAGEFDELEFDRYSEFHLLSRDVTETASDLVSAGVQLRSVGEDFRQALHRFGRVTGQVQDLLMKMRMMPVGSIESRLHRTVRVAANRSKKDVKFVLQGAEVELDKTMLAEITGPLEHILRNGVDHGLETAADRAKLGKPRQGTITLEASLDGHRAVLRIADDGRGLDPARIRTRAIEMGRFSSAQVDEMSDDEVFELIFQPGFTTAEEVSEISGRGVGLDAVRASVAGLGGSVAIESQQGAGTSFVIGLPTSLAVTRVLLVEAAGRRFCIPAHAIDKVSRGAIVTPEDRERRPWVEIDGRRLPAYKLADALHLGSGGDEDREHSILVVEAGERRYGLAVDEVMEARDAVVKSLGPLLDNTPGISSATVLGDGSVALILDPAELPEAAAKISAAGAVARPAPEAGLHVLMADDSISVRRVLMKTFEAAGWRYTAARDGQDALDKLRELDHPPDVALLDVEMPRMDGFQLTTALRATDDYANLPIVMLTSRAGEKHRRKATELGANDYLVKPYIEDVLLSALRRAARAAG